MLRKLANCKRSRAVFNRVDHCLGHRRQTEILHEKEEVDFKVTITSNIWIYSAELQ
jgi:hypothetical protein